MIYRAPGKIVLWGEYAVLDGAPAAVMAIDRYAEIDLQPGKRPWRFSSRGLLTPGVHTWRAGFSSAPAARLVQAVLAHWGYSSLPLPFGVTSDSSAFFADGAKLGLGSSAAVCVATYAALAELLQRSPCLEEAMAIHRALQGGSGSGMDVAASWHGGVQRFHDGHCQPLTFPDALKWQVVWTGASSDTQTALGDFASWRASGDTATLAALGDASARLTDGEPTLDAMATYVACLRAFDTSAGLNIFTPAHQRLATIATSHGLVYKPCGAGGGDIGIACGADGAGLDAFANAAANEQFVPLHLEVAPHGVKVSA